MGFFLCGKLHKMYSSFKTLDALSIISGILPLWDTVNLCYNNHGYNDFKRITAQFVLDFGPKMTSY